jgi:hypothetical protein
MKPQSERRVEIKDATGECCEKEMFRHRDPPVSQPKSIRREGESASKRRGLDQDQETYQRE